MVLQGEGGVGKSFLIKKLKEELKEKLLITSPTGAASHNIKGYTLHS